MSIQHPMAWALTSATLIVAIAGAAFYVAKIDKEAALREAEDRQLGTVAKLEASDAAMKLAFGSEWEKFRKSMAEKAEKGALGT
ncbi:hypothetical protein M427DRAFT_68966 [Gonapodya prolifera JEL478]|uniref:Uncharacterized protein n=1 Tax=Gonapodya prolifera (strain JEL478) TaxID=1344416 RepID=A0A139AIP9_GONPJ|nr:hypothetical protein M427DRAFT_68966 [Gonapodya prolifera JEL478]|eukprot:KXS16676.1 hypothetical protein M427DRAFT_68966 [Gonapodya prolifera JEL478]